MQKLNWSWLVVRADGKDQTATCSCGSYRIEQVEGGTYAAVFAPAAAGVEAVVLSSGKSHGVAYTKSTNHHKANHEANAVEAASGQLALDLQ
jgi:hypothetical protein